MKRTYITLAAMLLVTTIFSCKKQEFVRIDQAVDVSSTSQIKFFNFSVSAPSVNIYGNGTKLSATVSATGVESATGIANGSVYPASNYSVLTPGAFTFKAQIPSTATADANLAINSLTTTLTVGKYYSYYTSGLYSTTAKTSDAFVIEDVLPAYDGNNAYVRFVNTVPNAPAALSMYVKNTVSAVETNVATSIPYKSGSAFVSVPAGIYEVYGRYAAAPTVNVISRNGTSVVTLVAGRVYTLASRGDITVTSTTATTRPQFDFTNNR